MDTKTHHKVENGEEVFPTLYKLFRLGCCDCGLVHHVQFKIYKDGVQIKKPSKEGYRISMTAWRHNGDTITNRLEQHFPLIED